MKRNLHPILLIVAVADWLICVSLQAELPIRFDGGDGSSMERAVVIKGGNTETGIEAAYEYLTRQFPGSQRGSQGVFTTGRRSYERLEFTTAKGEKKMIFFDITSFYKRLD